MLTPGQRVGAFEIVSSLGAGGMGEVYRARDAKLNRDVAIKILPQSLALDADRLARFAREAQTLAALNHPNIAHIYGLEEPVPAAGVHVHALVMELVEGEDLSQRIARGPIPIDDALAIARQVADALEAAHEQGIVHRDIKPANIKVRPDGTVKVLDFGLAKAMDAAAGGAEGPRSGSNPENSPTFTSPAAVRYGTELGVILGTAAYMAPEQARGKAVDRRADIWAFGCVLYEMLSGQRPFPGEDTSMMLAAVLKQDVDYTALPPETPPSIRRLLRRCLEKDPRKRLSAIGDARFDLDDARESDRLIVPPTRGGRTSLWIAVVAGIAIIATAVPMTWMLTGRTSSPAPRLQLEIGPPWGEEFVVQSNAGAVVISPDASMVAFLAQGPSGRRLHVRSLATGETRAIPNTAEAHYPFWSPDSRSLAFFGLSSLFTVSIGGGLPEAVADIRQGRGGTWTDNGVILFTPDGGGVVHRVGERGGKVEVVTALDASKGENAHYWPVALPGGRSFLFFVRSTRPENNGIYLGSVDGGTAPVRLVTSLSSGIYAPGQDGALGHLLWTREGELLAQPLDVAGARLTGEVATVASDVRVEESQRGVFASVSATGTLVWASARASNLQLAWFDRTGRRLETLPIAPGHVMQPRISPDGRKLAFGRVANGTADVWLFDITSSALTQVTTDPDYDENASWSPDNRALLHQGSYQGKQGLQLTTVDGSRPTQTLVEASPVLGTFLPDGRTVLVSRSSGELSVVKLDAPGVFQGLASSPGLLLQAVPSPDGRWVTMGIARAGRSELVLARLLDDGGRLRMSDQRIPVSSGGGVDPSWRRDGREILYLAPDGTVMAVAVTMAGDAISLGKPAPLFRVLADAGGSGSNWAANADHSRFVAVDSVHGNSQTFRVLTDWRR